MLNENHNDDDNAIETTEQPKRSSIKKYDDSDEESANEFDNNRLAPSPRANNSTTSGQLNHFNHTSSIPSTSFASYIDTNQRAFNYQSMNTDSSDESATLLRSLLKEAANSNTPSPSYSSPSATLCASSVKIIDIQRTASNSKCNNTNNKNQVTSQENYEEEDLDANYQDSRSANSKTPGQHRTDWTSPSASSGQQVQQVAISSPQHQARQQQPQQQQQQQQSGENLSSFESDYDLLVYLGETETEDIVDTEKSLDYQDQTWRQSICGGASLAPTIDESLSELLGAGSHLNEQSDFDLLNTPTPQTGRLSYTSPSPRNSANYQQNSPRNQARLQPIESYRRSTPTDSNKNDCDAEVSSAFHRRQQEQQQHQKFKNNNNLGNKLVSLFNRKPSNPETVEQQQPRTFEAPEVRSPLNDDPRRMKSSTLGNTNTNYQPNWTEQASLSGNKQQRQGDGNNMVSHRQTLQTSTGNGSRPVVQPVPAGDAAELDRLLAEMSQSLDLNALARYDTQPVTGYRNQERQYYATSGRHREPATTKQSTVNSQPQYYKSSTEITSTAYEPQHQRSMTSMSGSVNSSYNNEPLKGSRQHLTNEANSILDEYDGASRILEQMISDQLQLDEQSTDLSRSRLNSATGNKTRAALPNSKSVSTITNNQQPDELSRKLSTCSSSQTTEASIIPARPLEVHNKASLFKQVPTKQPVKLLPSQISLDIQHPNQVENEQISPSKSYESVSITRRVEAPPPPRPQHLSRRSKLIRSLSGTKRDKSLDPPEPPAVDYDLAPDVVTTKRGAKNLRDHPESGVIKVEAAAIPDSTSSSDEDNTVSISTHRRNRQVDRMKRRTLSSMRSMRDKFNNFLANADPNSPVNRRHAQHNSDQRSHQPFRSATMTQPIVERTTTITSVKSARSSSIGERETSDTMELPMEQARSSRSMRRRQAEMTQPSTQGHAPSSLGQQIRERLSRSKNRLSKFLGGKPEVKRAQSTPSKAAHTTSSASSSNEATTSKVLFEPSDIARNSRESTSGVERIHPIKIERGDSFDRSLDRHLAAKMSAKKAAKSSSSSSLSGLDTTKSTRKSPARVGRTKSSASSSGRWQSDQPRSSSLLSIKRLSSRRSTDKDQSNDKEAGEDLDTMRVSTSSALPGKTRRTRKGRGASKSKSPSGANVSDSESSDSTARSPRIGRRNTTTTNEYFGQIAPIKVESPVSQSSGKSENLISRSAKSLNLAHNLRSSEASNQNSRPKRTQSLRQIKPPKLTDPRTNEGLSSFNPIGRRLPEPTNSFRPVSACAQVDTSTTNKSTTATSEDDRDKEAERSNVVTPIGPRNSPPISEMRLESSKPAQFDYQSRKSPQLKSQKRPMSPMRAKGSAILGDFKQKCSELFSSPVARRKNQPSELIIPSIETTSPTPEVPQRPPRGRQRAKSMGPPVGSTPKMDDDNQSVDDLNVIYVEPASPLGSTLERTTEVSTSNSASTSAGRKLANFAQQIKHSAADFFQPTGERQSRATQRQTRVIVPKLEQSKDTTMEGEKCAPELCHWSPVIKQTSSSNKRSIFSPGSSGKRSGNNDLDHTDEKPDDTDSTWESASDEEDESTNRTNVGIIVHTTDESSSRPTKAIDEHREMIEQQKPKEGERVKESMAQVKAKPKAKSMGKSVGNGSNLLSLAAAAANAKPSSKDDVDKSGNNMSIDVERGKHGSFQYELDESKQQQQQQRHFAHDPHLSNKQEVAENEDDAKEVAMKFSGDEESDARLNSREKICETSAFKFNANLPSPSQVVGIGKAGKVVPPTNAAAAGHSGKIQEGDKHLPLNLNDRLTSKKLAQDNRGHQLRKQREPLQEQQQEQDKRKQQMATKLVATRSQLKADASNADHSLAANLTIGQQPKNRSNHLDQMIAAKTSAKLDKEQYNTSKLHNNEEYCSSSRDTIKQADSSVMEEDENEEEGGANRLSIYENVLMMSPQQQQQELEQQKQSEINQQTKISASPAKLKAPQLPEKPSNLILTAAATTTTTTATTTTSKSSSNSSIPDRMQKLIEQAQVNTQQVNKSLDSPTSIQANDVWKAEDEYRDLNNDQQTRWPSPSVKEKLRKFDEQLAQVQREEAEEDAKQLVNGASLPVSSGVKPEIGPKPKLVAMTSIIQEPNDELMMVSVSTTPTPTNTKTSGTNSASNQLNKSKSTSKQSITMQRRDSTFSLNAADQTDNSDSDSSFAAATANRQRLVSKFQQQGQLPRPPSFSGSRDSERPKFPAFVEGKTGPTRGESLVKRMARNFDNSPSTSARPPTGKPAQAGGSTNKSVTTSKVNTALHRLESNEDPKSESTWYDAKSMELLDDAEVAELLREFDSDNEHSETGTGLHIATASQHTSDIGSVSTGNDPFVTVADSTLADENGEREMVSDDLDDDDTLNDGDDVDEMDTNDASLTNDGFDEDEERTESYVSAAESGSQQQQQQQSASILKGNESVNEPLALKRDSSALKAAPSLKCDINNKVESCSSSMTVIENESDQQAPKITCLQRITPTEQNSSLSSSSSGNNSNHLNLNNNNATNNTSVRLDDNDNDKNDIDDGINASHNNQDLLTKDIPGFKTKSPAAISPNQLIESTATAAAATATTTEELADNQQTNTIDAQFKTFLNNIIARRSSQPDQIVGQLAQDDEGLQSADMTIGLDSKSPSKSSKGKQLKGLTSYYRALLRHGRHHKHQKLTPSKPESESMQAGSYTQVDSESGKCEDEASHSTRLIHTRSSSSSSSSVSSSTVSSSCPSAAESEDDDDNLDRKSRGSKLVAQADSRKLVRAAKKCSRLYEELEKILARRAAHQQREETFKKAEVDEDHSRVKRSTANKQDDGDADAEEAELEDDLEELSTMTERDDQISLSSSSLSSESIPEIRQRQNLQKLYHIVNEIYSSEAKFVDTLKLLNVDFRNYILSSAQNNNTQQSSNNQMTTTQSIGNINSNNNNYSHQQNTQKSHHHNQQHNLAPIPSECTSSMLKHLPQLQALNENLLAELKLARDQWPREQKIAHVLVKIGPFLKHYSTYIREFEAMQQQYNENLKKYPQFAERVRQFESSERSQKLTIQHHLLRPIQRIPQYRLLLQQYLHHLKPDDVDYEDTVNALEVVSRVAEHANQSMNDGVNFAKLLALQAKIVGKRRDIVQPGRLFVKEGELMKVCRKQVQPRWFVLLSDALLYLTQIQSSDILYLNNELPLDDCLVSTPEESELTSQLIGEHQNDTGFTVCSRTRSFALLAKTKAERDEWVRILRKTIDELLARRRSFSIRQARELEESMRHQRETGQVPPEVVGLNLQDNQQVCVDLTAASTAESLTQQREQLLGRKAPLWTPDSRVVMCQLCTSSFSALFRRHHCRACGRVVCSACSSNRAPLIYLKCRAARVCDECFDELRASIHLYYLPPTTNNREQLNKDGEESDNKQQQQQLMGGNATIGEQELSRLEEHFRTLLKSQFVRHVGFKLTRNFKKLY